MSIALTYMIQDKLKLPKRSTTRIWSQKRTKNTPIITSRIEIGCLFFFLHINVFIKVNPMISHKLF